MIKTILDALPVEFQNFRDAVSSLSRLILQRRLFPNGHPYVKKAADNAYEILSTLLKAKRSVSFRVIGDFICYLNFQIDIVNNDKREISVLRTILDKLSIQEIEFENGVSEDELQAFVEILESALKDYRSANLSESWSRIRNIKIRFEGAKEPGASTGPGEGKSEKTLEPETVKHTPSGESKIGRIVEGVLGNLQKIQYDESRVAGKKILELVEKEGSNTSTILLLSSLQRYDDYTFEHSVNVAVISAALARHLGWTEQEIERISMAGLMHDIGKVYVPREIVHKRSKLSPTEWQKMKKHPTDGERILREEGCEELARLVAYEHHMRYDGTGYPISRQEHHIHDASNIVRIADSYDALTTKRPYRRQINPYEAIKVMEKSRAKEFHPHFLNIFMLVLGNVPIGSILKLNSGETVLVVDICGTSGNLPRVRVLKDADGNDVIGEVIMDLNEFGKQLGTDLRISEIIESPAKDFDIGKYLIDYSH